MLRSLRWAATHYVAPLSTVLARCAPPNLPRRKPHIHEVAVREVGGVLTAWGERQAGRGRTRPAYLLTGDPLPSVTSAIVPVLREGKNVIVTAPTVVEAHAAADTLRMVFGDRVLLATSDESPRSEQRHGVRSRPEPARLSLEPGKLRSGVRMVSDSPLSLTKGGGATSRLRRRPFTFGTCSGDARPSSASRCC